MISLRFFPLKSTDVRGAETRYESLRTSAWEVVCYTAVFSVVTQRSFPLLRDVTKNGCVADYVGGYGTYYSHVMLSMLSVPKR